MEKTDNLNKKVSRHIFIVTLSLNLFGLTLLLLYANHAIKDPLHAQAALEHKHKERYHDILYAINDAMLIVDPDSSMFIDVNPAAERLYGFSREEMIGMHTNNISVNPERMKAMISSAVKDGTGIAHENDHRKKDGTVFPVEVSINRIITQNKTFIVGFVRDITERERTQKMLRNRIELESIISAISGTFARHDVTMIEADINLALSTIGRFSRTDRAYIFSIANDKNYMANTHEWCQRGIEAQMQSLQNVPTANFAWSIRALTRGSPVCIPGIGDTARHQRESKDIYMVATGPDSSRERGFIASIGIHSVLLVPLLSAGRFSGFMGFDAVKTDKLWSQEDINLLRLAAEIISGAMERRRAHLAISESEDRVQRIFSSINDSIFVVDAETKMITDVNNAAIRTYGYQHDEIVGKHTNTLRAEPDLDADRRVGDWLVGKTDFHEDRHRRKDGAEFFVEVRDSMFTQNGRSYIVLVTHDVSRRKQLESELLQSGKLAAIGELASGVAHELNNPLAAVLGISSMLLEDSDPQDPRTKDYETIKQAALRAKKIITSMLGFSRRAQGAFETIAACSVVTNTLELCAKQLEDSNIAINFTCPARSRPATQRPCQQSHCQIECIAAELTQVFLNLILNARDAMPNGGSLDIKIERNDAAVSVSVTDSGEGIDAADIGNIFKPFFTTKSKDKGTGLGLSLSANIVQKHSGTITVKSPGKGKGSTFTVILPLQTRRPQIGA
ncbi:MAG: PAS domain S-box protein [Elusimicrobiota bacterium]